MRETPRSLRAYFILVGGLTVLGCGLFLVASLGQLQPLHLVYALQFLWGFAYLYVGVKLTTLLRENPQLPMKFAAVAIGLSCLGFNIIGILINVYIYYQLKRMAKEAAPEMESQVLE